MGSKNGKIIMIMVMVMLLLCGCSLGHIRYISGSGYETCIQVPDKYKCIKGYSWDGDKLIIEFSEE